MSTEDFNLMGAIKDGWYNAGKEFEILGESVEVNGQRWTPVKFLDEEDPTFFKTAGIKIIGTIAKTKNLNNG